MAVCDLRELVRIHPGLVTTETIQVLRDVLLSSGFCDQTQSFFLSREAADTLASIIGHAGSECLAAEAICALTNVLGTAPGHAHRAAAGALGSLPVAIQGPKVRDESIEDVTRVKWHEILEENGGRQCDLPARIGRSLVVGMGEENKLLVVKLAQSEHSVRYIYRALAWMEHLYSGL